MKRRTILAGVGSLLGGGALAVQSGAFSFVRADRSIDVVVQHDNDAYLGLRQLGGGGRSVEDGTPEQVRFSFPGVFEESPGDGLGVDSVYEFTNDADGPGIEPGESKPLDGLLGVTNQGTKDVEVTTDQPAVDPPRIELFDVTDEDRVSLESTPVSLEVGEKCRLGFRIDTHGADAGTSYEREITLVASV